MTICKKIKKWFVELYKTIGKKLRIEEENEISNFYEYLNIVREDYENQSKKLAKKLKLYSYVRVVLSCSIPVAIIYYKNNQVIPILISSSLAILDFLLSFNKLPDKLHQVDNTINLINYEYNLFIERVGKYKGLDTENANSEFKEKMINIIYSTDNTVTNKYDINNIKEFGTKVQ